MPPSTPTVLIEAQAAGFSRHGEPVFAPVDVRVTPGEAVVITGANGSGKTTLLRLLAGIIRPACGDIRRTAGVAFMGHRTAVKGDLEVGENLRFEQRLHGRGGLEPETALERVGLAGLGRRATRTLSAGQLRRLGLASLLVARRDVWLLDEPYASLDADGCRRVDELLEQHLAAGGGAALSAHQRLPGEHVIGQRLDLSPPVGTGT